MDIKRVPQLPLGLTPRQDRTFENFYVGQNSELVYLVQQHKEPFIFVWGSTGSGVSHLLQAACQAGAVYVPLTQVVQFDTEVIAGLEQFDLIAIDDIQLVSGIPKWEESLFHLFNRVKDLKHRMIIGANSAPRQLKIALKDLGSRLASGVTFKLEELNDQDKIGFLKNEFELRGIQVNDELVAYILHRAPRTLNDLRELVYKLDRASLAAKRPVTLRFVKELMGW